MDIELVCMYLCITIRNESLTNSIINVMTNIQLIQSNPAQAYNKIINTQELSDRFDAIRASMPTVITTEDNAAQTKAILMQIFA